MAAEHVKTWEGAGWMLSFRDNGHNDDDNDPTRARKRGLIYRLNHERRRYAARARTLVAVTAIPTTANVGV